jgi:hypothetical protein
VVLIDTDVSEIAKDGSFGRLRVTAHLHSRAVIEVEQDVTIYPAGYMPEIAPSLYLRKAAYSIWRDEERVVAYHLDPVRHRQENPTYPYHKHIGTHGEAQPLAGDDPRAFRDFLDVVAAN